MDSKPPNDPGKWQRRILAMERDLKFIYFLLGAPLYKGRSPNLYERLQQYGAQAGAMEEDLRRLGPGQEEALLDFESRLMDWKAGVYEFLESKI
ncbi:MAG: hypothetical protein ACO20F_06755 [Robiginitalea sp.]|jgi:hypothetical protein|nr:MAG: hypothetical protein JSW57_05360 [Flavobacteriaceae bacterium]